MALYEFAVEELGRKRDFFPAYLLAAKLSSGGNVLNVDDLLDMQYASKVNKSVVTTLLDPDRGAGGDWQALRDGLKHV